MSLTATGCGGPGAAAAGGRGGCRRTRWSSGIPATNTGLLTRYGVHLLRHPDFQGARHYGSNVAGTAPVVRWFLRLTSVAGVSGQNGAQRVEDRGVFDGGGDWFVRPVGDAAHGLAQDLARTSLR